MSTGAPGSSPLPGHSYYLPNLSNANILQLFYPVERSAAQRTGRCLWPSRLVPPLNYRKPRDYPYEDGDDPGQEE